MLTKTNVDKAEARKLVESCFRELYERANQGFDPCTNDQEQELHYQNAIWDDVACSVTRQLATYEFDFPVEEEARGVAKKHGLDWRALSYTSRADISSGVARAFIEQYRLFKFRQEDRLSPYIPTDPLFLKWAEIGEGERPSVTTPQVQPTVGPTVAQVTSDYIDKNKLGWTPKTLKSRQTRIG